VIVVQVLLGVNSSDQLEVGASCLHGNSSCSVSPSSFGAFHFAFGDLRCVVWSTGRLCLYAGRFGSRTLVFDPVMA
jgi:hypothetical protein